MARIMAIGAHPDDIEIGVGATLRKLIRDGHEVACIDLTDGEPTPHGTRELRQQETAKANAILGITDRTCLELPNRILMDTEEARRRLASEMRRFRPEIVFTHVERDAHPDHVAAAHITRGAILLSRIVKIDLEYDPYRPGQVYHFVCSHLRYAYQPDFILAVSEDDHRAKLDAIGAYESQFGSQTQNAQVTGWLETRMQYFGSLGRTAYGEAFLSEEPVCVDDITLLS